MSADQSPFDLKYVNFDRPAIGIDGIRAVNPQRNEFEMLTGIVHVDTDRHICIGFKDLSHDEFWIKGHFPGYPMLPGVLMCEAAAQLCGYYIASYVAGIGSVIGLAGIDEARFHRPVRPGKRLVMVGTGVKIHRRLTKFRVVGSVEGEKSFEVLVSGLSLGKLQELRGA